ncbi:hypothetical protein CQ024_06295 [Brevundimonas sp. MYb27]|nr:hypothetical protein CQ024_06295 [Brevundimonas sp. MYb27]
MAASIRLAGTNWQSGALSAELLPFDSQAWLLWGGGSVRMEGDMDPRSQAGRPEGEGEWTLLQQRIDRSFWQQTRSLEGRSLTTFVIVRSPEQLRYDTFDEAEAMFEAMDED